MKMISNEVKIVLKNYFASFTVFFLVGFASIYLRLSSLTIIALTLLTLVILGSITKLLYTGHHFLYAITATCLGITFTAGIYIKLIAPDNLQIFGAYLCIMAFFHLSEFVALALVQPKLVSFDTFVINHSPQYLAAVAISWLEFLLEAHFFPEWKQFYWLSNIGIVACVAGDVLRKVAILTAGSSFNHLVQCKKKNDHVLVTHGVYGWFRHPSYVGWFYWSVATQIVLLNPFCIPAYTFASWFFFKERIFIEEIALLNFFGTNYCEYQRKVGTGLPFIKGYIL